MTPYQAFSLTRRCTKEEFRQMRKSLGFSHNKLAHLFGLTGQSIARMEKGETRVDYTAEILLRAMVIEEARMPLNFISWVKRFAHNQEAKHGDHE